MRWSKVRRVSEYQVRIDLPRDGRRLLRFTKPGSRTLRIGGIEPNDTGTIRVQAISAAAEPGKAKTARLSRR